MAQSDLLNTFDAALGDLKASADATSVDLATDGKSDAALTAAQTQKETTAKTVADDLALLQTKLDAVNASGSAMGLKINAPTVAASVTVNTIA